MSFISGSCTVKMKNTIQATGHVVFSKNFNRDVQPTTVFVGVNRKLMSSEQN